MGRIFNSKCRAMFIFFSNTTVKCGLQLLEQLSLPDIPVIPLFTDIPFTLDIKTTTAPLSRAKADDHLMGKPIFPAPPSTHSELSFRLTRQLKIRARGYSSFSETDDAFFLGEYHRE